MRVWWMVGLGCITLLPGLALAQGALPTVIRPQSVETGLQERVPLAPDGHFHVRALVNGAPLPMLFDTGATIVALRAEDAPRLGIDPATLSYSLVTSTANGQARAAPVTLDTLTIGGITRRNVVATVSQPGRLAQNLLGQSFLMRLSGYRQEGSNLVFLDRP